MMTLQELKKIASEHNIVTLTGFGCYSTDHRDWVPSAESLRWLAIRAADLKDRQINHLGASTRGVFIHFENEDKEFSPEDIPFEHAQTEAEALQSFLESQGILKSTRVESFWDRASETRTSIVFDPNINKVKWFDGEWVEPKRALELFSETLSKLVDEDSCNI